MTTRVNDTTALDAIFVPATRLPGDDSPGLVLAAELASEMNCYLIIVCSKSARARQVQEFLRGRIPDCLLICVDVGAISARWLPTLESNGRRLMKLHRLNDVGKKRNLALSLSAAMGWTRLLFMDDDIFAMKKSDSGSATLDSQTLEMALREFDRRPQLKVIGWRSLSFEDNSVVGHARRYFGMKQDVFLGSGALLIRCDAGVPFFPDIYNEDWLFMIATAMRSTWTTGSLGLAGHVGQLPYDPFDPRRARSEEAGDLMAEGLMNLLEDQGTKLLDWSTDEFWRRTIMARRKMLRNLRSKPCPGRGGEGAVERDAVDAAIDAALIVNTAIKAREVTTTVLEFWADLVVWDQHFQVLRESGRFHGDNRRILHRFAAGGVPPSSKRTRPVLAADQAVPVVAEPTGSQVAMSGA